MNAIKKILLLSLVFLLFFSARTQYVQLKKEGNQFFMIQDGEWIPVHAHTEFVMDAPRKEQIGNQVFLDSMPVEQEVWDRAYHVFLRPVCWKGRAVKGYTKPPNAKRVVLISIDGMRPEFYLDSSWPAPNLRQLMKGGVYAMHMQSVFPAYTYPSHTAMLTGALPSRSSIYYNVKDDKGGWNWYSSAIKIPTLWQAMKKTGLTSSAVEWPVSVDPNIDFNVPEIWDPKHPSDRISETRKYATAGLIDSIEKYATGKLDSNSMDEEYFSLDENSARIAAYIFKAYRPSFLALHFACVDDMEHAYGRDGDSVRLALASADRGIGEVMEAIERSGLRESTTVIVVGDHGFSDMERAIRINKWLLQNNLLDKAKFMAAGGSAFLYLNDKSDPATLKKIERILDTVSERKFFRMIFRTELDAMGADSSAVLALGAKPGTVFANSTVGELVVPVHGGHHGYDPALPEMWTGFIAAGAGINKGKTIESLCVTDIAPLVAALLGIEFKTPDGKLPAGIIK